MAVMQTPHGRVIGLILPIEDQPIAQAIEKAPEPNSSFGEGAQAEAKVEAKAAPAKKAGRPAKK